MSDFFGGILDSISHVGDDVSGFFNSAIGQAVAKGAKGGFGTQAKQKEIPWNMGFYGDTDREVRYTPTNDVQGPPPAEDFTKLEIEWLNRLHRFAGLDNSTEVKLGDMK